GTLTVPLSTNAATGSGVFSEVSTITIGEGVPLDFPNIGSATARILAPEGWEFRAGPLDTSASTLASITSVSAEATTSEITITWFAVPATGIDVVRINGLHARPLSSEAGEGTREGVGAPGNTTIAGFNGAV